MSSNCGGVRLKEQHGGAEKDDDDAAGGWRRPVAIRRAQMARCYELAMAKGKGNRSSCFWWRSQPAGLHQGPARCWPVFRCVARRARSLPIRTTSSQSSHTPAPTRRPPVQVLQNDLQRPLGCWRGYVLEFFLNMHPSLLLYSLHHCPSCCQHGQRSGSPTLSQEPCRPRCRGP